MTLTAGNKLGPYEIVAPIGAGGMGEVYRARDPRIGRDIAVKVLPTAFSKDPERLRRFEQEARAAGVLNHPNILAIYDVGAHDDAPYVVSELLQGETLRDRLKVGILPPRKAIDYATQIAQGLAAAHEQGIVHRDLKPENLFLTRDGRVKILDFGLAKLTAPDREGAARPTAPTLPADTGPGAVWGTVGYMSPEQVRGHAVDHRSDIFALGAILYEMLSGKRAFKGASPADTLSAILKEDPPELTGTAEAIPPALERIVFHCLEKNPGERFQSARDLAFNLEAISGLSGTKPVQALGKKRRIPGWLMVSAAALLVLAVAILVLPRVLGSRARPVMRFPIELPLASGLHPNANPVISPDGSMVVFPLADSSGVSTLWLRRLDSMTPMQIPGTKEAFDPFWAPDSRSIGFFAEGKLKRVSVTGGPVQIVCDAGSPRGGTWSKNDVIVFAPGARGGLYRVDAAGGDPISVTFPDSSRGETAHRYPCFLPDGKHFLFLTIPERNGLNDVFAGSIGSKERKLVLRATRAPWYAAPGFLLFSRGDLLLGQRFDPRGMKLQGDAVTIAETPTTSNVVGAPTASASNTGAVVYRRETVGNTELGWYNGKGELTSRIPAPPGRYGLPRVSPDGSHVVLITLGGSNSDLWLIELKRGTSTRLTSDPGFEEGPQWSSDGKQIVYNSDRLGGSAIFLKSTRGGDDELLYRSPKPWTSVWDWSADGRYVVFRDIDPVTGFDLWILPTFGDRKPFPYLVTRFEEQLGAIAPNGHWMAYVSDESGRREVYVQSFPKPGNKQQISLDGGFAPIWSLDGRELFYGHPSGRINSVAIRADTASIDVGSARTLFTWPAEMVFRIRGMDVAPGGRFVAAMETSEGASRIPVLILNWPELMKRKE